MMVPLCILHLDMQFLKDKFWFQKKEKSFYHIRLQFFYLDRWNFFFDVIFVFFFVRRLSCFEWNQSALWNQCIRTSLVKFI